MTNETSIEYQSISWQWGWESVGVISSGMLSVFLIAFTVWIAIRQNKIQEKIAKDQEQLQKQIAKDQDVLQKQIADRDINAQNYQHRIRCYLQMIKVFEGLTKTHGFSMGHLYDGTPLPIVTINDMDKGYWMMFQTKKEAQLLFSADLAKQIADLYELYAEYSQKFTSFYFSQPKLSEKLKHIDEEKYMNAHRDPKIMQEIENISPEWAWLIKIHCMAQDKFKSDEFNNLIIKEIKPE